ncbi:hypothetical protein L3V83_06265 [Thiotrichales bacterium 19X7-9]|nr:hypothetical protein [Thiotrichales bacterium 19X7-9]
MDKNANTWQFHWFVGPDVGVKLYDQKSPLLDTQSNSTIHERYFGGILGGLVNYNNLFFQSHIDATFGKGQSNIKDTQFGINQYTSLNHYMMTFMTSTGYRFKYNNFSFIPGIFNTFVYSISETKEPIKLGPININQIKQTITQSYAGLSFINRWHYDKNISISLRTLFGYIYFNRLQSHTDYSLGNFTNSRSITLTNHRGYYFSLSMIFAYRSHYGEFLFIPWAAYTYIPNQTDEIDYKLNTLGIKLIYLIGS